MTKVFVGNLPDDVRTRDIEDIFYKFGRISDIQIKFGRQAPHAFVEFDDDRDADDAVRYRDGYHFDGYVLRVEHVRSRDRSYGGSARNGRAGRQGSGAPRRSEYRLYIEGLPSSGSWQDLKDHMREAGDVLYADVFKDSTGVVEYQRAEDVKYALKKLDESRFRSHEGETTIIRVREEKPASRPTRSSARSRSKSRSRSRGKSISRSRATPTYSPMRSRSGS